MRWDGTAAGGTFVEGVQTGAGWSCCKNNMYGLFNNDAYPDIASIASGNLVIFPGKADGSIGEGANDTAAGTAWGASSLRW
jgi:hypothetical protein